MKEKIFLKGFRTYSRFSAIATKLLRPHVFFHFFEDEFCVFIPIISHNSFQYLQTNKKFSRKTFFFREFMVLLLKLEITRKSLLGQQFGNIFKKYFKQCISNFFSIANSIGQLKGNKINISQQSKRLPPLNMEKTYFPLHKPKLASNLSCPAFSKKSSPVWH